MGGASGILRFLYATEIIDYEWYPQNPLERSKLDMLINWLDARTGSGTGLGQGYVHDPKDLDIFDSQFFEGRHTYVCGFDDPSIADIIAFFAIFPFQKEWFSAHKESAAYAWAEKLQESEEISNMLGEIQTEKIVEAGPSQKAKL